MSWRDSTEKAQVAAIDAPEGNAAYYTVLANDITATIVNTRNL